MVLTPALMRAVLRRGPAAARPFFRSFTEARTFVVKGPPIVGKTPPTTTDEVKSVINGLYAQLRQAGAFYTQTNRLNIIVFPEMLLNVTVYTPETGIPRRVATLANFISQELHSYFIGEWGKILMKEAPGIVLISGTNAFALGQQDAEGNTIVRNGGAVIASGDGSMFQYSKAIESTIDLPKLENVRTDVVFASGDGPVFVSVKDVTGDGRPCCIGIYICVDITKFNSDRGSGRESYLGRPDAMVIPGWGIDKKAAEKASMLEGATVIMADGQFGALPGTKDYDVVVTANGSATILYKEVTEPETRRSVAAVVTGWLFGTKEVAGKTYRDAFGNPVSVVSGGPNVDVVHMQLSSETPPVDGVFNNTLTEAIVQGTTILGELPSQADLLRINLEEE